jgi:ADP-ribosyl-[dinitrogen reductase] hydrolase
MGDSQTFLGVGEILAIASGAYLEKQESSIRGSGYVVDSLEAAMWCFSHALKEAVLMAADLGDDADTKARYVGRWRERSMVQEKSLLLG